MRLPSPRSVPIVLVLAWAAAASSLSSAGRLAAQEVEPPPDDADELLGPPAPAYTALPAWDEWYLDVDEECRLYVTEYGSGDTVVVLHGGWGAEHHYLMDAFAGLEREHHLVFYDMRGSLRSPCPDSTVSVERHLADLDRLREALGLERMVLAGHSVGTFLGMRYLEAHPGRLAGLVLFGALQPVSPLEGEALAAAREAGPAFQAFRERPEIQAELDEEGLDRPAEELSARERTHAWRVRYAAVNIYHVDRWRQMKGGQVFYDAAAGRAAAETMAGEWDFTDDLEAAPFPITVINGTHDLAGFGGEVHAMLLDPIPNVEFVLLERAGHNAWIDRPAAFREALRRALERYGS